MSLPLSIYINIPYCRLDMLRPTFYDDDNEIMTMTVDDFAFASIMIDHIPLMYVYSAYDLSLCETGNTGQNQKTTKD